MSNRHAVTNRVRHFRDRLGWSQAILAERCGLSRSEVSAIEVGRLVPSAGAALRLALALGVRVEDAFSLSASSVAEPAWPSRTGLASPGWTAGVGGRELEFPAETLATGEFVGPVPGGFAPRNTLVLAACDPAAGLLARELNRAGYGCLPFVRSSRESLELLAQRRVHVAGVHLAAGTEGNMQAVGAALGAEFCLVRVAHWEECLVSRHDTRATGSGRSLRALRWVGRPPGSGARRCSDELLGNPRTPPDGYDCHARDHFAVAEAIRAGLADVGVCHRIAAESAGLRSRPVAREAYDLVFLREDAGDPRIRAMLEALSSRVYRESLAALPGFHPDSCGEVIPSRAAST